MVFRAFGCLIEGNSTKTTVNKNKYCNAKFFQLLEAESLQDFVGQNVKCAVVAACSLIAHSLHVQIYMKVETAVGVLQNEWNDVFLEKDWKRLKIEKGNQSQPEVLNSFRSN